jgi:hypothetical protein
MKDSDKAKAVLRCLKWELNKATEYRIKDESYKTAAHQAKEAWELEAKKPDEYGYIGGMGIGSNPYEDTSREDAAFEKSKKYEEEVKEIYEYAISVFLEKIDKE